MTTITQLPDDLIFIILENEIINVENIVNFKSTCERFQNMILSNNCSIAEKSYNKEEQKKIFPQINFKERVKIYSNCIQMLKYYVVLMSENKLHDIDKTHLESFLLSIAKNSMTYYFVWDEINKMSAKNHATFLLFKTVSIYTQIKFLKMPITKLLLEKQLTIMAQYFVPHLIQLVLLRLRNCYPTHSILSTSSFLRKLFAFWRGNNIDDNFWDDSESKQLWIGDCFRIYLLTVTYHIVSRRLNGIHSHLNLNDDIDIVVLLATRRIACRYFRHVGRSYGLSRADSIAVIMTSPGFCVGSRDASRFIWDLRERSDTVVEKLLKRRPKTVKFAVGMIVKHNGLATKKHYGVIVGWHLHCNEKDKLYKYWTIMFPNLQRLLYIYFDTCKFEQISDRQSLYIILTDNDRICYVREGMLFNSILIDYILICVLWYFYYFKDIHYVPNANLKKHYPKDTSAIENNCQTICQNICQTEAFITLKCINLLYVTLQQNFFMNMLMYFEDFTVKIVIFRRKFKKYEIISNYISVSLNIYFNMSTKQIILKSGSTCLV
ncbi:hypothetical protein ACFW04_013699 [Cataglyphis niger]